MRHCLIESLVFHVAFTVWLRMLSCTGVAMLEWPSWDMATPSPGVPGVFPPFLLFFQSTEECHTAMAQQPWSCSKLWWGPCSGSWPCWTSLLPTGRQSPALKAFAVPRHRPLWGGTGMDTGCWGLAELLCQAGGGTALCCSPAHRDSVLWAPLGQCLKPQAAPASPCPNGNLTAKPTSCKQGTFSLLLYQTWSHQALLLAARKFLPLTVLLLRTAFLG